MDVRVKNARESAANSDGFRVLIDGIWPRGVSKEQARLGAWMKELAPSAKLRKWFDHEPERFAGFRRRYMNELQEQRPRLTGLRRLARDGRLTLVYGARDSEHNNAVVLAEALRRGLPRSDA